MSSLTHGIDSPSCKGLPQPELSRNPPTPYAAIEPQDVIAIFGPEINELEPFAAANNKTRRASWEINDFDDEKNTSCFQLWKTCALENVRTSLAHHAS